MIFLQLLLVVALLLVCGFAPGFFFIRRLPWTPLEKLCGSIALSLMLVYLAAWAIYCFGPTDQRPAYWVVAGLAAVAADLAKADALRLFKTFRVRQALQGFGFLLLWVLAALGMIRLYSGAGWYGDWYEHFQRSLFFLDRLPHNITILGWYTLPARPPLMNVLAAFFLGLTGDRFALFQVVFGFLNILSFLPAFLLLPALGPRRRAGAVVLVALFACSPVIIQHATYTWTKALPVFYVLLALALYLAGLRKRDSGRTAAAFLCLSAGLLAHYSTGPYLAFLALHYGWRCLRERPHRSREAAWIGASCGLFLSTWFVWSTAVYGFKTTAGSNTSVTFSQRYQGTANAVKIARNLADTIVPTWLRGGMLNYEQPNAEGKLRDQAFSLYQLNLIHGMGLVGGPVALWLLYRALRRRGGRRAGERSFWLGLIAFCTVAGVAVVGERDSTGVAQLTLLTIEVVGVAAIAAFFHGFPRALKLALLAGCVFDFYFGVWLQERVQSLENTPSHTVFPAASYASGRFFVSPTAESLLGRTWDAWMLKHSVEASRNWLRDLPRGREQDPLFHAVWPVYERELRGRIADDEANSGGWMGRHDGYVAFLGDSVAGRSGDGVNWAAGLFALLFGGLMWRTVRASVVGVAAPRKAIEAGVP
jgi:hypothetical protein